MTRSERILLRSVLEQAITTEACELNCRKWRGQGIKNNQARLIKLRQLFKRMGGDSVWWEKL